MSNGDFASAAVVRKTDSGIRTSNFQAWGNY